MAEEKEKVQEENPSPKESSETTEEVAKEETSPKEETSEAKNAADKEEQTAKGEEQKTGEAPAEEDKKEKGKKKFTKKKDKRDEQIEELTDRVKRQLAEFENFRTRSEKEKSQMYDMGAKSIVEKILPVVDNFERGLAGLTDEQKADPFAEGIDKVYTQLMTELSGIGVVPIEALGEPFDPELHNAVMQTETEEYESGTVAQELQKGYKYHDTVVRHSMVAVAQ